MFRITKNEKQFIKCAEDDSQLGKEAAFVITNANYGSFFRNYSENLMDALNYPHDDIEASLRLFYYIKKVGFGNTENFCEANEVDWDKFKFIFHLSTKIMPQKVKDPRSCKPCDECACIDLLRMMFAKIYLNNTFIHAGGSAFFNYNRALLVEASPDSIVHFYSKMWDSHPAVYFKLHRNRNKIQYANFLCLIQPMMRSELMFSEITDSEILIGKAVAERVIQNVDSAEDTLGRFALFCGYNNVSSKLSVKYAKHIFGQLKAYIEKQMEVVIQTTRSNRRHYWMEESKTLVVIGSGFRVQELYIGEENSTDALLISLNGNVESKYIKQLKEFVKDTFISASSKIISYSENKFLLAILPTLSDAQQLMKELTDCKREATFYRFDFCSDLWDYVKEVDFAVKASDESCSVCAMVPDEKKFIRLSLCGHIYCDECLMHYLRSVESFPLKCIENECLGILLVDDIDALLFHFGLMARERTEPTFSILIKHSLAHYLQTNKDGYRRCLTNNCSGILDPVTKRSAMFGVSATKETLMNGVKCCVCQKFKCGLCGRDVHQPVGCQQYFQSKYELENPGINKWQMGDPANRRFCPNNDCHAIIEKAAGCNHMQCLRCRKHFCWICEDFQSTTSREIYAHLEDVHRGNGAEGLEAWEDYME